MRNCYTLLLGLLSIVASAQTNLILSGDSWKFNDKGLDLGATWKSTVFDDALWASGISELGYGDADEKTVLSYGANSAAKYTTTYFRKSFAIADATLFTSYTLNVKRDDGLVVYVNGAEVSRLNMPLGNITSTTFASTAIAGLDESTWQPITLSPSSFVTGTNTIAVEIHQADLLSSDISFDLTLVGNTGIVNPLTITRGPYLQKATSSGITLKWQTSIATDSKVTYGTSMNNLNLSAVSQGTRTDHTITLTGLSPYTHYYYTIGNAAGVIQGDISNHFMTNPSIGTEGHYNFLVLGDCGTNTKVQKNVRDKYFSYMNTDTTHGVLLVGDNAYDAGLEAEYQSNFFNIYQNAFLKNVMVWPAPGNHDYANNTALIETQNVPYYTIFDTPENGESGGIASNNQAFYAYDYGNIHFLSLDSYGTENNLLLYDTLGPQVTWIKKDLAANKQKWTVAYWHHPPYTMGSHNSDLETDLEKIRTNFIKILERMGVDLILCGHSHNYERSKLMKGHYGKEATFDANVHNKSQSSGVYDGSNNSCPYQKNVNKGLDGTVYVVTGSAGKVGGAQVGYPHNAMHYANATNAGALALSIKEGRLDAKFICEDGIIRDQFTMLKDANQVKTFNVKKDDQLMLKASWKGEYQWSNSLELTRTTIITASENLTIIVKDKYNCVADTFKIVVNPLTGNPSQEHGVAFDIYPNPTAGLINVGEQVSLVQVFDLAGKQIASPSISPDFFINISTLRNGVYLLRIEKEGKVYFEHVMKN
jgi:hypothetical protein